MEENNKILPHHEQQSLCTTRLPYRQGRKLTAVKVYSITNESNHLLIFGVPSLNLRQEARALFIKFGKLLQFSISSHVVEAFTETYHAQYEKIQSARIAKRMLDTKNFYGGSLHVTYAPELESVEETKQKLIQRQQSVLYRLRNIDKEEVKKEVVVKEDTVKEVKLNMGELNTIIIGPQKKRKKDKKKIDDKRLTYTYNVGPGNTDYKDINTDNIGTGNTDYKGINTDYIVINNTDKRRLKYIDDIGKGNTDYKDIDITNTDKESMNCKEVNTDNKTKEKEIDVVDCTDVNNEVISNINEALNYNKFGNEVVRKVPERSVNKIKFYVNKKS